MPQYDLRDCSRAFLEACADTLETAVKRCEPMQERLEAVKTAMANDPPEYNVDHRSFMR